MSVLTNYFFAVDDGAALHALSSGPQDVGLPTVALKHIDPLLYLGYLVSLAREVPWEPDLTSAELISPDAANGPWINVIGNGSRDTLAGIAASDHERLAADWAAVEEFAGMLAAEDGVLIIAALSTLARDAATADQRLYCWLSL
jgi:hypothetical protein